jgi:hypothetical protein
MATSYTTSWAWGCTYSISLQMNQILHAAEFVHPTPPLSRIEDASDETRVVRFTRARIPGVARPGVNRSAPRFREPLLYPLSYGGLAGGLRHARIGDRGPNKCGNRDTR